MDRTVKSPAFLLFILFFLLLVGCQSAASAPVDSKGKLLLWHGWTDTEAETLANVLQKFNEIHPNVTVVSQQVPPENLLRQYEQAARLGLGPDLFIGPSEWLLPLADQGLILNISPFTPTTENYFSRALRTLTYDDNLYGLPLSLRPIALYFNTDLVETPAANLDEWLAQAANGRSVAMDANFLPSFWGLQGFGGRLFDDNGRVVLDEGGYANWLRWMQSAQSGPGMILSRDNASLRALFFSGKAAYYTGSPDDLPAARAALGEERVAVAPLPNGPVGPSGPLLNVEAIYFNPASRPQQTEQALLLSAFLTNAAQATTLLREISRIPANRTVPVDPRLHPAEAGFAAQARTAVAITNVAHKETAVSLADDLNRAALAGAVDVTEATQTLANEVNRLYGFTVIAAQPERCQAEGLLRIWHPWNGRLATALDHFVAEYQTNCPNVEVVVLEISEARLRELYSTPRSGAEDGNLPDLLLGSSDWLVPFVTTQSIQPLNAYITPDIRQRFLPTALGTVEYQAELYGLPYWLDFNVLYLNNDLVSDPPLTLSDLRQAANGIGAALPTGFIDAYWGATAHGSTLFSNEYRLALAENGFVDWLTWLLEANSGTDILLDENPAPLQAAFLAGEKAMLVGSTTLFGELEQEMNGANLGVTQLPSGPGGAARPWLRTTAFFLTAGLSEEQRELALSFAFFATNASNQTYLMEQTRLVPVNVAVNVENAPFMSIMLQSANNTFVPPNVPQITAVLSQGNQLYRSVLSGQAEPLAATCQFTNNVDRANGFSVAEADLPLPCR